MRLPTAGLTAYGDIAQLRWLHNRRANMDALQFCAVEPRVRSKYRFPDWQPEYEAAIAETDIEKLKVKTAALEDAIFTRCQTIAGKLGYDTERDAIQLAIDTLRDIQKTKLGYPPWEQYLKKQQTSPSLVRSR